MGSSIEIPAFTFFLSLIYFRTNTIGECFRLDLQTDDTLLFPYETNDRASKTVTTEDKNRDSLFKLPGEIYKKSVGLIILAVR